MICGVMKKEKQFGELCRAYRLQCHDPDSGKPLTQARLAEELERETGVLYTPANISSWERNKSRIDQDARIILVGLINVFQRYGSMETLADANGLLTAGNYRTLNQAEINQVNPSWLVELPAATAVTTTASIPLAAPTLRDIPLASIPAPMPLPSGTLMPMTANPLFVGRQQALQTLAYEMKKGGTVIITGMGGVGKTQLAVEFAHRYGRYFYGGVFWINFCDPDNIPVQIGNCGSVGHLALRPDFDELPLTEQVDLVRRAWQEPLPRLLIFDDCDQAQFVKWRPPYGGCRILVTHRSSQWDLALGTSLLPLDTLPRTEGISLLQQFRPGMSTTTAAAIATELGDLPLALHLAGSFLRHYQADVSPATYLYQLQALHGQQLLNHPSLQGWGATYAPTNHELHVNRTFALSYNQLNPNDEIDAQAQAILARAAYLAPGEPIPRKLLLATLLPTIQIVSALEKETHALSAANALARLVALGLIQESQAGTFLRLHRLLAEFVKGIGGGQEAQIAVENALITMAQQCNQTGNPALLRLWQPHLQYVTTLAQNRGDEREARLSYELGYHLLQTANYQQARYYLEHTRTLFVLVLGENHPDTAVCLKNLGMLLRIMGNTGEAQVFLDQALHIQEQILGTNHPETALTLQEIGVLFYKMGQLAEAQIFLERTVAIHKQVLGENHPSTARSLNDLGLVLQEMGNLLRAQQLYEQALSIYEQTRGPNHPDTATSLQSLGILRWTLGDLAGAKQYYSRAYDILEQVVGANHPHVAFTLNGLGILHMMMDDLPHALPYLERAVAICEQTLGGEHPDTAISLSNLGRALEDMGDLTGAESLLIRAQTIMEQARGSHHPDTATSLRNLGELYSKMHEFTLAQQYYERALTVRKQVLGLEHPQTAQVLNDLGALMLVTKDAQEARPYLQQALTIFEQSLGSEHPKTKNAYKNLQACHRPG